MSNKLKLLGAVALAQLVLPSAADAQIRSQTGSFNGHTYTAQSTLVGVTSTANGTSTYNAPRPAYNGVVALIMQYDDGGFICSGTLAPDRRSIVTAAHCVADGTAARPNTTTAYFYNGSNPDQHWSQAGTIGVDVSNYFVHSEYTGEVIDQNDIAVLRLGEDAPVWATAYDFYFEGDLTGELFNVAGYGNRSNAGGNVGVNVGNGVLRQGDNRYDFALGDSDFDGYWNGFFGTADVTHSYLSDFDNGLAANDASCRVWSLVFGAANAKYCNLGVGAEEVGVAGGDSGGPGFIDGRLASVNSYGLSFGTTFGDVDGLLNTTFGEFSGYVPLWIHEQFIRDSLFVPGGVPEPATWTMLISGFGLIGVAARRNRRKLALSAN